MSDLLLGSLCTGFGGLDLALAALLDVDHAWHAEVDPAASRVLAAHWPDVPNLGDITNPDNSGPYGLPRCRLSICVPAAWRHPWQVYRCTRTCHQPLTAVCSHRFEVTAGWHARLRWDRPGWHHDVRPTPGHPKAPR